MITKDQKSDLRSLIEAVVSAEITKNNATIDVLRARNALEAYIYTLSEDNK